MMHHFSWETGFKIKGDKQLFGCLDWLCEQCWLAVGYPDPVQLKQAYTTVAIYTHYGDESLPDGEQLDTRRTSAVKTRPPVDEVKFGTTSAEDEGWRPDLGSASRPGGGRRSFNIFHTFCTWWDLIYIKGKTYEMWTFSFCLSSTLEKAHWRNFEDIIWEDRKC